MIHYHSPKLVQPERSSSLMPGLFEMKSSRKALSTCPDSISRTSLLSFSRSSMSPCPPLIMMPAFNNDSNDLRFPSSLHFLLSLNLLFVDAVTLAGKRKRASSNIFILLLTLPSSIFPSPQASHFRFLYAHLKAFSAYWMDSRAEDMMRGSWLGRLRPVGHVNAKPQLNEKVKVSSSKSCDGKR